MTRCLQCLMPGPRFCVKFCRVLRAKMKTGERRSRRQQTGVPPSLGHGFHNGAIEAEFRFGPGDGIEGNQWSIARRSCAKTACKRGTPSCSIYQPPRRRSLAAIEPELPQIVLTRDFRDPRHLERSARTNSRFAQGSVKAETIQPPSLSIRIEEKISRYQFF